MTEAAVDIAPAPRIPSFAEARLAHSMNPEKKVAICGFASSSRDKIHALISDNSYEIWGLNSLYAMIPRWNRWFEIHPIDHVKKDLKRGELVELGTDHISWLRKQKGPSEMPDGEKFCPIYMQEHFDEIPASVPWPRREINEWHRRVFGPTAESDYFTSTPAEMLAQACFEGFGEIHCYGIDLLQDEEYAYQRPCFEYWIGVARGLGAVVVIPNESALMKANYVYGYSEPISAFGTVDPLVNFFKKKTDQIEANIHEAGAMLNRYNGAREVIAWTKKELEDLKSPELDALFAPILEKMQKQDEVLAKQAQGLVNAIVRLGAQKEFAASSASWTGHFGRGGKLEGE